jgi:hypothetical protein
MVRGMGEASFDELLPWLMSTLTSETSSVDRSGAAQVNSPSDIAILDLKLMNFIVSFCALSWWQGILKGEV